MRLPALHDLSLCWLYFYASRLSPFWSVCSRSYVMFTPLSLDVLLMMFIAEVDKWTRIAGHRIHRGIQRFLCLQPLPGMHHVHVLIRMGVWGHLLLISLDVQLHDVQRRDRCHPFWSGWRFRLAASAAAWSYQVGGAAGPNSSLILIRLEV
jgi:hypothetical protein